MRIELSYAPATAPETSRTSGPNDAAASPAASAALDDQTQLSGAHIQVQVLATLASQLPEVRQERVQTLRQAVASGHYKVSHDELAAALLAHLSTQRAA